jgi:hypothetical protein
MMEYQTEKRYESLRNAVRRYGLTLSEEQKQFVQDFALLKLNAILKSDPNLMDALKRLKDK